MKIALYIEDGLEQIVLTPETDTEKAILGKLSDGSRELSIKKGSFYACQGGWTRQRYIDRGSFGSSSPEDVSTMIILTEPQKSAEPPSTTYDGVGFDSHNPDKTVLAG